MVIHSVFNQARARRASRYGTGARRCTRRPIAIHPLLRLPVSRERDTGRRLGACSGQLSWSPYLHVIFESLGPGMRTGAEAAGNETPEAGPAWPQWPGSSSGQLTQSPQLNLISESRGLDCGQGGGSWKQDTGRLLGSGSDQLRPDSGAARGPGTGTQRRGPGCQPVTPPGQATWPSSCLRPRLPGSGERSALPRSRQDRGSLDRTARRLCPAGLRLATSTTLTVAASSGRCSRISRACLALEWGDSPSVS